MSESGVFELSTLTPAGEPAGAQDSPTVIVPPAPAPDALAAFYNAPTRRRARANTAKAHIGTGERPQEIYTPQPIVDAILRVWPRIELDPCSGPNSIVPAMRRCYVPASHIQTPGGKTKIVYVPGPGDMDGLKVEWPNFTYSNPPFGLLERWMRKAAYEAGGNNPHTEIMQLVPVRTHRRWWRDVAFKSADVICWLDPVRFIGYSSGFPAPLALLYWGDTPRIFRLEFEGQGLGECQDA